MEASFGKLVLAAALALSIICICVLSRSAHAVHRALAALNFVSQVAGTKLKPAQSRTTIGAARLRPQGGSIPVGARFQLRYTDAQIDAMTGLAAWEKTLLHQLHEYGLYVLDTGGNGYITYKWESPTQYTSFGGTPPGAAWVKTNHPPSIWKPRGISWATDLQLVNPCYAEATC